MAYKPFKMSNMYEPHGEINTRLWYLLPIRLYVGIYFVISSIQKVANGMFNKPEALSDMLAAKIDAPGYSYGFYRSFFHSVVEPYPWLFVFLVVFGELLVGLALVTGTLTRLACLAGLFLVLNFFLAFDVSLAQPDNTVLFGLMLFVLLLTGAGRAYGMDHYLRGKAPDWMT